MRGRDIFRWLPAVTALALAVAYGCGGPPQPDYGGLDLSEVDGVVMLDGEPLTDAIVLFEAADHSFSYGKTDNGGRYQLMFNSEKSGVSKGAKTVRIWSSRAVPGTEEMNADEDAPESRPKQPERVPANYNVRSTLTVTVDEDTHTFDFDLQS